jgi:hypothetical protein
MALIQQAATQQPADETGAAGQQYLHRDFLRK